MPRNLEEHYFGCVCEMVPRSLNGLDGGRPALHVGRHHPISEQIQEANWHVPPRAGTRLSIGHQQAKMLWPLNPGFIRAPLSPGSLTWSKPKTIVTYHYVYLKWTNKI